MSKQHDTEAFTRFDWAEYDKFNRPATLTDSQDAECRAALIGLARAATAAEAYLFNGPKAGESLLEPLFVAYGQMAVAVAAADSVPWKDRPGIREALRGCAWDMRGVMVAVSRLHVNTWVIDTLRGVQRTARNQGVMS